MPKVNPGVSERVVDELPPDARVPGAVVVGIDDSVYALSALYWAATEASSRDLPLVLAHVRPTGADPEAASRMLSAAAAVTRRHAPGVDVRSFLISGAVGPLLVAAGQTAELLVLGVERDAPPARYGPDGPVEDQVAALATCPVVVVPLAATAHPAPPSRVVLGWHGSGSAERFATSVAAELARRHRVELRVVESPAQPAPDAREELGSWLAAQCAGQELLVLAGHPYRAATGGLDPVVGAVLRNAPCPVLVLGEHFRDRTRSEPTSS